MPVPRVRFAPAPSGWLHVGGARTALYNWLHARQGGGTFVLRPEDTDAERVTAESLAGILAALRFLGMDWDEGPEVGGPHGPYIQSERLALHQAVGAALLDAGVAYEAFETPEELEADRAAARAEGRPPVYKSGHRDLTPAQREAYRADGRVPALRIRTPDDGAVTFADAVRGEVTFAWADVGDYIALRADRTPTYLLANAVDDLAMGINLVARGEDLLSVTPRQLLLYDALLAGGLLDRVLAEAGCAPRPVDAVVPAFAHLPLLVGADRKPLSKRHGSVAVDEFRRQGILPEALFNFIALCGWGPGEDRERFDAEELIARFGFERVSSSPAFFDTEKLRSMNGDRLRELAPAELAARMLPLLVERGVLADPPTASQEATVVAFAPLVHERAQTLADAIELIDWAFADAVTFDAKAVAKWLKPPADTVLDRAAAEFGALGWTGDTVEAWCTALAAELGAGLGRVMQPLRVAVSGRAVTPPLPQTLAALDRDLVRQRIREARGHVLG